MTTERDWCAEELRRHDPDRHLTALFAPAERRDGLMALYAFNLEIARVREIVSEPMLGEIRLQWWRDAIVAAAAGKGSANPVAASLGEAIRRHDLPEAELLGLIDARRADLADTGMETVDALVEYSRRSSGAVTRLALRILGAEDRAGAAGEMIGTAWALVGSIRSVPHRVRAGRPILALEVLERHNVDRRSLESLRSTPALSAATRELAELTRTMLAESRPLAVRGGRAALPALLPGVLAEAYLARLAATEYDPFDPRNAAPLTFRAWRLIGRAIKGRY